jgi:transposase
VRPLVKAQHVREYLYAFAAICPHDGQMSSFITDHVNAHTMSLHLQQVADEYPDEDINMTIRLLPPYSPELNPVEHLWDEIREKYFANRCFDSLDAVADMLLKALRDLHHNKGLIKSMSAFPWIVEELAMGNWH